MGEDMIREATQQAIANGRRILQFYLFGDGEGAHARKLLDLMNPKQGAQIVDLGCGIGEVSRRMLETRPDLRFVLVNNNRWQLYMCDGETHYADMHDTGLLSPFDVVMVNYAIGYARLSPFLAECRRLLRLGGALFICDMDGHSGILEGLGYTPRAAQDIIEAARPLGFKFKALDYPDASVESIASWWDGIHDLTKQVRPMVLQLEAA